MIDGISATELVDDEKHRDSSVQSALNECQMANEVNCHWIILLLEYVAHDDLG